MTDSGRRATTSGLDRLPNPCCHACGHHPHPSTTCPADQRPGVPCPCAQKETHHE